MIVVEGCDGTGKTTLVNRLAQEFNLRIGKRGTPNRDELYKVTREDTYRALAHAVEGYHPPFVWDRLGPFSDPIYARVLGREDGFKHEEMRHCMEVIKALRCPVIVCHLPLEEARANAEMAHQLEGVSYHFELIWGLYDRLREALALNIDALIYNYQDPSSYERISERVHTYLIRRKDREWH